MPSTGRLRAVPAAPRGTRDTERSVYVGRAAELHALRRHLDAALAGTARLVLLVNTVCGRSSSLSAPFTPWGVCQDD